MRQYTNLPTLRPPNTNPRQALTKRTSARPHSPDQRMERRSQSRMWAIRLSGTTDTERNQGRRRRSHLRFHNKWGYCLVACRETRWTGSAVRDGKRSRLLHETCWRRRTSRRPRSSSSSWRGSTRVRCVSCTGEMSGNLRFGLVECSAIGEFHVDGGVGEEGCVEDGISYNVVLAVIAHGFRNEGTLCDS
jgi:hypothetical protein